MAGAVEEFCANAVTELEKLRAACEAGDDAAVSASLKTAEEMLSSGHECFVRLGVEERRKVKGALTAAWSAVSGLSGGGSGAARDKARARRLCSEVLETVVGSTPSAKLEQEVAKAWLRTGRDWLLAQDFQQALSASDRALRHAKSAPGSQKASSLVADALVVSIEARWKLGTDVAAHLKGLFSTSRASSSFADVFEKAEDVTRFLDLLYDIADVAHKDKKYGDCVDLLAVAMQLCSKVPISPTVQTKLLRLQGNSLCSLGKHAEAMDAISAANAKEPSPVGDYLQAKCLIALDRIAEANQVIHSKLAGSDGLKPRMASNLVQWLVKAKHPEAAIRLLKNMKRNTPDSNVKLFTLLCSSPPVSGEGRSSGEEDADAFDTLSRIANLHINNVERLTPAQLTALYCSAFDKAHAVRPEAEAIRWLKKVVDIIPPSEPADKAKAHRALAWLQFEANALSDALANTKQALALEGDGTPASAPSLYLLIKILIVLDDCAAAQAALRKLEATGTPLLPKLSACAAQFAYAKNYPALASAALQVMQRASAQPTYKHAFSLEVRHQILVNTLQCCEEAQATKGLPEVFEAAARLFEESWPAPGGDRKPRGDLSQKFDDDTQEGPKEGKTGSESPGLAEADAVWWRYKADVFRLFKWSAAFSKILHDVEGQALSLLRFASVALDEASSPRDGNILEALSQAGDLFASMPFTCTKTRRVHALLTIKARVLCGDDCQAGILVENLAGLDGVQANDFEVIMMLVAPGTPHHRPAIYKKAMEHAIEAAWPETADQVPLFAHLIRRSMIDAAGREEQWHLASKAKKAVLAFAEGYPAPETEWLVAEAWNNGIYYNRLGSKEKAESWMSLSHTLSQHLPQCDTRAEVEAQFDLALERRC